MKRAALIVGIAALCVAGSAVAQDRSGQWLGNGGRSGDDGQIIGSGSVTGQTLDSGGFLGSGNLTADASGGLIGSGTRSEDSGQVAGSGNAVGQMLGSGGFTMSTRDQVMGSGGRADDGGQILGSGAGKTSQDGGYLIGGGRDGYFGSGLSILALRLPDGSSVLVVTSDEGIFVLPIEE